MHDQFILTNHFKPTDRNSYIPLGSRHHSSWLCNIPRGQYIRLRRNCTTMEDFGNQSQVLSSRFEQKGYNRAVLDEEVFRVMSLDRKELPIPLRSLLVTITISKWCWTRTYNTVSLRGLSKKTGQY